VGNSFPTFPRDYEWRNVQVVKGDITINTRATRKYLKFERPRLLSLPSPPFCH
jgi:hypothetical protein